MKTVLVRDTRRIGTTSGDQAVSEVYDYPYWNDLYGDIYGNGYVIDLNDEPGPVGAKGVEKDGLHRRRGSEGENHKALRL